jgi:hypothetical protein
MEKQKLLFLKLKHIRKTWAAVLPDNDAFALGEFPWRLFKPQCNDTLCSSYCGWAFEWSTRKSSVYFQSLGCSTQAG